MKWITSWLGAGVATLALTTGCSHAPVQEVVKVSLDPKPAVAESERSGPGAGPSSKTSYVAESRPEPGPNSVRVQSTAAERPSNCSANNCSANGCTANNCSAKNCSPNNCSAAADGVCLMAKPEPAKVAFLPPALPTIKAPPVASPDTPLPATAKNNAVKDVLAYSMPARTGIGRSSYPAVELPVSKKPNPSDAPVTQAKSEGMEGAKSVPAAGVLLKQGHAPDYTWLCGELQYSRFHKNWRLRYAGLDEADTYGGSVTLAEESRTAAWKDGVRVRVQGRVTEPGTHGIAPIYEVTALAVLDK